MGSFLFAASVEGQAELVCCDNADPYCSAFPEKDTSCLYHGQGKIILRSKTDPGSILISVTSPELEGAQCTLHGTAAPNQLLPAAQSPYINDWFVSHVWEEEPDIYQYTPDIHYICWQKYPSVWEESRMPFYFRKGWVIFCMEPDMPQLGEGKEGGLVFESIRGQAKLLVSVRDYNNVVLQQFYAEKESGKAAPFSLPLPGVASGSRLIIKVVVRGDDFRSGIGAVRFEEREGASFQPDGSML